MPLSRPESYIKQLKLYMQNHQYKEAVPFAQEFVHAFPDNISAHFFLARASLYSQNLKLAEIEGRAAFNMAASFEVVPTAVLLATVLYFEGKFEEGRKLLEHVEKLHGNSVEIKELLILYDFALDNPNRAAKHAVDLIRLDHVHAGEFLRHLMGG